jgi:hypothetical protein
MKTTIRSFLCLGAVLGSLAILNAQEVKPAAPAMVKGERWAHETVSVKVTAINHATREVTVQGPMGDNFSFTAGPEVKRLAEVAVGDTVTADYYAMIAGEVRAPTNEEKLNPLVAVADAGRASKESLPAGAVVAGVKVVGTIVGLDATTLTVKLRGPKGNVAEIPMQDPVKFSQLKMADTVIVTYVEALLVSLQKAPPAAAAAPATPAK